MALDLTKIENNFEIVFSTMQDFKDKAAKLWSEQVFDYMETLIPVSLTHEAGKQAFYAEFMKINFTNGIIQLPKCFEAYNDALIPGMLSAPTPFNGVVPPKGVLNLVPVYTLGLAGGSYKDCAKLMSSILYPWYLTGTATNVSTGATISWS